MDIYTLIEVCKEYDRLGSAIQEQLDAVVEDRMTPDNVNPNALSYIEGWLDRVAVARAMADQDAGDELTDIADRIERFRCVEEDEDYADLDLEYDDEESWR